MKSEEMGNDLLKQKSKRFAIRIVNMYRFLCEDKKEYTLSKQILRSGTSIGANIAESACAMSKKDFLAKIYIALKECAETLYWLDLLYETGYIREAEYTSMKEDCEDMYHMLQATTKTLHVKLELQKK